MENLMSCKYKYEIKNKELVKYYCIKLDINNEFLLFSLGIGIGKSSDKIVYGLH